MGKSKDSHDALRPGFETSLKSLEGIVDRLEGNEIDLQTSLQEFESGVNLARHAQRDLKEAEQKVSLLLGDEGPTSKDFQASQHEE